MYTRRLLLIPQVRLARKYPIPPWEMIHLPVGIMQFAGNLTWFIKTKYQNPSNKLLVNNNK
jgi:hypothetical protein